jgi:hypothetical protein
MAKRGTDTPVGRVTNSLSRGQAGGGMGSNKVVAKSTVVGSPARGKNPNYTAQIGIAIDPRAKEAMFARGNPAGGGQVLGNQKALDVGRGGPGTGRTVFGSGTEAVNNGSLRPTPTPSPPSGSVPGTDGMKPWGYGRK